MWYKGISFTNENSAITYLVDAAGARTTTDHFVSQNMYDNLLNGIFYELVSSAIHVHLSVSGKSTLIFHKLFFVFIEIHSMDTRLSKRHSKLSTMQLIS